ncbi:cytochrome b-c1 complex subunit 10-like [Dama dama]|uniref:cytochrome b-c1 complex subunit 10-like n=1 Tax=Dama dama TaxID=30532 RepID=UPI002A359C90|nr:cytochrome b-c1 complex subunit 10-like [Dama dama]
MLAFDMSRDWITLSWDGAEILSRFLGPHSWELAGSWIPTVGMWGAVGTVGLAWGTAWQLILGWVPYINSKFKKNV